MNGNEPAFPMPDTKAQKFSDCPPPWLPGLTKREWMAGMVLSGFAANPRADDWDMYEQTRDAAMYADALLAELAKAPKQ